MALARRPSVRLTASRRSFSAASALSSSLNDPVEIGPNAVQRFGHHFRVAQGIGQQLGTLTQDRLSNVERFLGMTLLDAPREAVLEIRLVRELRKMDGK